MEHIVPAVPPLLIYLPGLPEGLANSARRVADILADTASEGPGTLTVQALASPYEGLGDGGRIVRHPEEPVLDVLELDYRPGLFQPEAPRSGLRALVQRLILSLRYVLWAARLLRGARRRAKTGTAKVQILVGLLSTTVLLLSAVVTLVAVLVALGLVGDPEETAQLADALAIGLTAVTTWLFVRARPAVVRTAVLIQQLMDFVHDDRREGSVARKVTVATDQVLETDPGRQIYLLGYSLGSLVAIAFAFPRSLLHVQSDERHAAAVSGLFTIGCPADLIRLYLPRYLSDRTVRVDGLSWTNIYIAADVMASNFVDGNDAAETPDDGAPLAAMAVPAPVSLQYTSQTLTWFNIWGRKGFLSHGGYWDEVGNESCLRLVLERIPGFQLELPVNR